MASEFVDPGSVPLEGRYTVAVSKYSTKHMKDPLPVSVLYL